MPVTIPTKATSSKMTVAETLAIEEFLMGQIDEAWMRLAHQAADLIPSDLHLFSQKHGFDREIETDETWDLPWFLRSTGNNPEFFWCFWENRLEETGFSSLDDGVAKLLRLKDTWKSIVMMVIDYEHDRIIVTFAPA